MPVHVTTTVGTYEMETGILILRFNIGLGCSDQCE